MADPLFGTEAYAYTGRDMFNKLLASILGSVIPGGEAFAGMASGPLQTILGIQNDVLMDSVLFTNMTPYGASRVQDNAIIRRLSQSALGSTSNAAKYQAARSFAQTLTSYEAWQRLKPTEQLGSYQAFIDHKAQSYMGNMAWNYGYSILDPLGMNDVNKYMSMAAANMTRFGIQHGNRNAYVNTKAIMNQMFRDDDGNYNFDKTQWGYFNNGEIAAITAAITKHIDAVGEADISKPEQLKNASRRLQDLVKGYAEALSPLKDVFGSDIPAMIRSIEELAGQDIAQMGPERARAIANMALDRTSTGRYSMSDLSAWGNQFNTLMRGMDNIPVLNKLNGTMYASFALDAVHGDSKPRYMTSASFMNMAAEQVIRTANSQGADDFAKTYALWAERQRLDGKDTSFDTFNAALNAEVAKGTDRGAAMLTLADVSNRYDLNQGLNSEYYIQAKEAGVGALLAFDTQMDRQAKQTEYQMAHDVTFRQGVINATGRQDFTAEKAASEFRHLYTRLRQDPDLLNKTGDELTLALALGRGGDVKKVNQQAFAAWQRANPTKSLQDFLEENGVDTTGVQTDIAMVNQLRSNGRYTNMHGMLFMRRNQEKQSQAAREAANRRVYTERLSVFVGGMKDQLIDALGLSTGQEMDLSKIRNNFTNSGVLATVGSEEARNETLATMEAAATYAKQNIIMTDEAIKAQYFGDSGLYGKDSTAYKQWQQAQTAAGKTDTTLVTFQKQMLDQIKQEQQTRSYEFVRDSMLYTNSAAGLGNTGYRTALGQYMNAKTDTEKESAITMMSVYRTINEDAVNRFLSTGQATSADDTGFKAWVAQDANKGKTLQQYNEHVRSQQQANLVAAYKTGGSSGASAMIENTAIERVFATGVGAAKRIGESDEAFAARTQVLADFRNAGYGSTGYGTDANGNHIKFDQTKFSDWISAQKRRIDEDSSLSDTVKRDRKAALDELAGNITTARQGVTPQANPLQDILKTVGQILNTLLNRLPSPSKPGS
jgi:hypothetical protein